MAASWTIPAKHIFIVFPYLLIHGILPFHGTAAKKCGLLESKLATLGSQWKVNLNVKFESYLNQCIHVAGVPIILKSNRKYSAELITLDASDCIASPLNYKTETKLWRTPNKYNCIYVTMLLIKLPNLHLQTLANSGPVARSPLSILAISPHSYSKEQRIWVM